MKAIASIFHVFELDLSVSVAILAADHPQELFFRNNFNIKFLGID